MGFWSGLGKVIAAPVYVPYKIVKKIVPANEKNPVRAVIKTTMPEAWRYYYEGQGLRSTPVEGGLIVWQKNVSEGDKKKFLEKLNSIV